MVVRKKPDREGGGRKSAKTASVLVSDDYQAVLSGKPESPLDFVNRRMREAAANDKSK